MLRLFFALIFCLLFTGQAAAQPLIGNYTIGGSGADYATINAAVTDLNLSGVSGPVVFSIASGVYNESLVIGPITGASATNTITFQSAAMDSTAVTIAMPTTTTATNNYLIRLSGASHLIFRHLTFERTGTNDYSLVIDITNASQYITFFHNRIIGPTAATAAIFKCLVYGANASTQSNLTFDGNFMSGGSYGIWLAGNSQLPCCTDNGNVIINNHLTGQFQCGIYLQYQNGPQIIGNTIQGTSTASGFGIYTFFADNNLRILKNRVAVVNGKGIYVHNTSIAGIPENLIANNFVSVGGAGAAEGIFLDNSRSCHIYHNSVHIYNTATNSTAFRINGIGSAYNELKNNNLVNSGGGYAIYVTASTSQPFNVSDYNNLYVSDTLLGFWQASGSHATLTAYRSASNTDINSVSIDPGYLSNTDLHATSVMLNNRGTPALSSATPVTDDIDGELRSIIHPDMGADEYSVNELELYLVDTLWTFCEGNQGDVKFTLINHNVSNYADTLVIWVELAGVVHDQKPVWVTIAANDTVMFSTGSLNVWPSAASVIPLRVWISDPWDVNRSNDTLSTTVTIIPPVSVDLGGDIDLCDNLQHIIAPAIPLHQYLWHDSTMATIWIADALKLLPGTNSVWLSGINDRGCQGSDTIVITLLEAPQPNIAEKYGFYHTIGPDTTYLFCHNWQMEFSCGSFAAYLWNTGSTDSVLLVMPWTWNGTTGDTTFVSVQVTAANGCVAFDTTRYYLDICESVPELTQKGHIELFPNPLQTGQKLSMVMHGHSGDVLLRIFNFLGQEIDKQEIEVADGIPVVVETTTLVPGVYMLQCTADGRLLHSGRVVVR